MHDNKSALTTQSYHISYLPLPDLAPSLPLPASDRCDIAGGPVPPSRRSAPAISRFSPVLGWRTFLQLLARRAAESIAFSVPDRNALWSRAEDDLLVLTVAKYSTSDVLFRDWSEVALELPGRLPHQCKKRYRLPNTMVELIFLFLRGTFRGSPFLRSALVLTKDADSADSARPTTAYASPFFTAPSPSPPTSLTHVHSIQTPTPTLLTFTCTQVLWFLSRLTRPRDSHSQTSRLLTSSLSLGVPYL